MTTRRAILLTAMLMVGALVATPAASALAQTADLTPPAEPPPDYAFDNGTVVIGGDATTTCSSFAAFLGQGYFESGDTRSAGAQRVLEKCVEAGLLDPQPAAPAGAPVSASTSPEAAEAHGKDGGLPDTGGPDLPALLAAAAFVISAGMLSRCAGS